MVCHLCNLLNLLGSPAILRRFNSLYSITPRLPLFESFESLIFVFMLTQCIYGIVDHQESKKVFGLCLNHFHLAFGALLDEPPLPVQLGLVGG